MHDFDELAFRCTDFTLQSLSDANARVTRALIKSGSTTLVKSLQMIQLQKAIFAVGMFSMFEAYLQGQLNCKDGFKAAREILEQDKENGLKERFDDVAAAINVLKHGSGRSYNYLLDNSQRLPFRVRAPGGQLFNEGDISEVMILIDVDDDFVRLCSETIKRVSVHLRGRSFS
ncbi:hypothetical protein ACQYZG_07335 [Pseudomonas aeruginosa]|uniref:hypothetical protein n=1 Tax=Pseudomonas aeruginosa TaxID=287 RepID=UPI001067AC8D|nr:hypothetical protein [Pseudomonas aeruginosa]MBH9502418.1 hypothetical protein [Pseudomonas aeruginosa]MDI3789586.1 hypothetical protein [Pseudomonas aeruginosa]TEH97138.1 hypothetical protein IPC1313_09370 [Pseudomonas aeruginosa]TEI01268.1 hypothetical protein IPC1312_10370 [Pseudomonas aeruginosa]TEI14682.1 hypothetical protein IPC1311_05135 [Pseudomonas aeruginosa]